MSWWQYAPATQKLSATLARLKEQSSPFRQPPPPPQETSPWDTPGSVFGLLGGIKKAFWQPEEVTQEEYPGYGTKGRYALAPFTSSPVGRVLSPPIGRAPAGSPESFFEAAVLSPPGAIATGGLAALGRELSPIGKPIGKAAASVADALTKSLARKIAISSRMQPAEASNLAAKFWRSDTGIKLAERATNKIKGRRLPVMGGQDLEQLADDFANQALKQEPKLLSGAAPKATKAARLSIRPTTYRGQSGFQVVGKDSLDRNIKVFAETRLKAESVKQNIIAGREAFEAAPPVTPEAAPAAELPKKTGQLPTSGAQQKALDWLSKEGIEDLSGNTLPVDDNGMITLYHRTSRTNAEELTKTGRFISKENTGETFFSSKPTGQAEGYGDTVVKVKVPAQAIHLDDAFKDEMHITVSNRKLALGNIAEVLSSGAEKAVGLTPSPAAQPLQPTPVAQAATSGAGAPPIQPPVKPPTMVATPDDLIREFGRRIASKEPELIAETQRRQISAQKSVRVGTMEDLFQKNLDSGMGAEEALFKAAGALRGKYEVKPLTLGDVFEPIREQLFAKIDATITDPLERLATGEALRKVLDTGKIADVPGIAGGSQLSRLRQVFADHPEILKALENPDDFITKNYPPVTTKAPPEFSKIIGERPTQPGLVEAEALETSKRPVVLEKPIPSRPSLPRVSAAQRELELQALQGELKGSAPEVLGPMLQYPEGSVGRQVSYLPNTPRVRLLNVLKRIGIQATEILNLPRIIQVSYDVSMPLRQGLVLGSRFPIKWGRSVLRMMRALKSEKIAAEYEQAIWRRPHTGEGILNGLYLAPISQRGKVAMGLQEEARMMARWIRRIPGVQASERSALVFLNDLRSQVWEHYAEVLSRMGADKNEYKAVTQLINQASGRGDLPKFLEGAAPIINQLLFSPRLFLARLQLPTRLFSSSHYVRKETARILVAFLAAGASLHTLGVMMGGKSEKDPRSAAAGKIKVGNTYFDPWGGYQQYARFVAQFITSQRKTQGGEIVKTTRYDVVERFAQSKGAPLASLVLDLLRGENYIGEELRATLGGVTKEGYDRLTPLVVKDIIDAMRGSGMGVAISVGLWAVFGGGVTTYKEAPTKPSGGGIPIRGESPFGSRQQNPFGQQGNQQPDFDEEELRKRVRERLKRG